MATTAPDRRRALAFLIVFFAACSQPTDRPLQGYIEGEYNRVGPQFAGILQQLYRFTKHLPNPRRCQILRAMMANQFTQGPNRSLGNDSNGTSYSTDVSVM